MARYTIELRNVIRLYGENTVKGWFSDYELSDYLTDEELQEKQYKGRFWDVSGPNLYILVDDETLVVVDNKRSTKIFTGREHLPYSLQGRHYYDEH